MLFSRSYNVMPKTSPSNARSEQVVGERPDDTPAAIPPLRALAGLEDHPAVVAAVPPHLERRVEAQVADAAALARRRLRGEPVPSHEALALVGVHREVADLERGQVLEEVAALRRGHAEVAEAGLD